MSEAKIEVGLVPLVDLAAALKATRPFASANLCGLEGVDQVERVQVEAGAVLVEIGEQVGSYWVILDGEVRAEREEADGSRTPVGLARTGEGFGEAPLLTGKQNSVVRMIAARDSLLVRFTEQQFWQLLAHCPLTRREVLGNTAQRLQAYQVEALHKEKLISLGTLAAGLMHELHNPGSAARRSASHLRENLERLQELSLRASTTSKTPSQLKCMNAMLQHAFRGCTARPLSSLDQSDAEEALSAWLDAAGVENAYTIGPALVAIGFDRAELDCAKAEFDLHGFSDALNWLEALVSSVTLVDAIEESIGRISDLVVAVKKFAYNDRSMAREIDVHESLQSTLTILGHKLRMKQIDVAKCFSASPATVLTRGMALSQVWTNLIDNAVDASPENGKIEIATWLEPRQESDAPTGNGWLVVSITDYGQGIPAEAAERIFEPFFTTKPQGAGTGLGLEIVHRIVTQKFGGTVTFQSQPGRTEFLVRLPRVETAVG